MLNLEKKGTLFYSQKRGPGNTAACGSKGIQQRGIYPIKRGGGARSILPGKFTFAILMLSRRRRRADYGRCLSRGGESCALHKRSRKPPRLPAPSVEAAVVDDKGKRSLYVRRKWAARCLLMKKRKKAAEP